MAVDEPSFTIGIEEEYLLVNRRTRALEAHPPPELREDFERELKQFIKPEFLQSQVEVSTKVCKNIREARTHLAWLRGCVAKFAAKHDLAPIAASTHPFSEWQEQEHTDKERYNILARDMQAVARRLLIGGMHVHVGIEDVNLRIDLLNQAVYFLPHILALSTSSPFWRGQDTGLKSYRLAVFDELPRTGLPERFDTYAEYRRHVDTLVKAGILDDATMLWWDIRPSDRFPTLEMRITDVCPKIEDAMCIAAMYVCVLRYLYRLRRNNQRWRIYPDMLIKENRWRAERYGLDEGLVDFGKGQIVPCADLFEELIDMVGEDAEALGCLDELLRLRVIVREGTSAHRQIRCYQDCIQAGMEPQEALNRVVDMLIEETLQGVHHDAA